MPFELTIPLALRKSRWRVKIRDKENREPPHVTILRGTRAWRINLRDGEFMDRSPDPGEVPNDLLEHVKRNENWTVLCDEWDRKYPTNPVARDDDEKE